MKGKVVGEASSYVHHGYIDPYYDHKIEGEDEDE